MPLQLPTPTELYQALPPLRPSLRQLLSPPRSLPEWRLILWASLTTILLWCVICWLTKPPSISSTDTLLEAGSSLLTLPARLLSQQLCQLPPAQCLGLQLHRFTTWLTSQEAPPIGKAK